MFDKTRGLKWYRVIQCLSILWILTNLTMTFVGPIVPGFSAETVDDMIPRYTGYYRVACFASAFFSLNLFVKMKNYDPDMLKAWLLLWSVSYISILVEPALFYFAYCVKLTPDIIGGYLGRAISATLWCVPTYKYLRKRCFSYRYPRKEENLTDSISPAQTNLEYVPQEKAVLNDFPTVSFCRFCGNKLRDNSNYCDNCGKKVR